MYYGTEFKGTDNHAFGKACRLNGIGQKFARINRPQTNGKAERIIRALDICGTARFPLKTALISAFSFPVSSISSIP